MLAVALVLIVPRLVTAAAAADLRVASGDREIVIQGQQLADEFAGQRAPNGRQYLTLSLAVQPLTEAPLLGVDVGAASHLEDANGVSYRPEPLTPPVGESFLGARDIEAWTPAFGQLVFIVPIGGTGLSYVYEPDGIALRVRLDGTASLNEPGVPLLSGPIEKGGIEFGVQSVVPSDTDGPALVLLRVTNRNEDDLRMNVGTFVVGLENGRYGYPVAESSGEGFFREAIFVPGVPRTGTLRFAFPPTAAALSLTIFTEDGVVSLPLTPGISPLEYPTLGGLERNNVLTAQLRGWQPTAALTPESPTGSIYAVADIDIGLADSRPMTSIDVGPEFISLITSAGEQLPASVPEGLDHPMGRVPVWSGQPIGGKVAFVVPERTSLAGASVQISGADPVIRLRVDGSEAPPPTLSLSFEGTPPTAGVPIAVQFSGMPGNTEDWLSVAAKGSGDDQYIQSISLGGQTSGRAVLDSLPEGDYELRAYFNWPANGYRVEQRRPFNVVPKAAVPPGSLVSLARSQLEVGDRVAVTWQGFPGFDDDWIAIARKGDPDTSDGNYHTLHGQATGRFVFDPLPAGDYELRGYFKNEHTVQDRVSFSIAPHSFARTTRDDAARPGETNVALVERGAFIDWGGENALVIADGDAATYDDDEGFVSLNPALPNRIWLRRPYPIEGVRFLLAEDAAASYRYLLKGTSDGVTWSVLSDHSAEPVDGGWQDIAVDGRQLVALSFENLEADGDAGFRLVEFATYTRASVNIPDHVDFPSGDMPDWTTATPIGPVNVALPALGARIDGDGAGYALDGLYSGYAAYAAAGTPLTLTLDRAYPLQIIRIVLANDQQPAFKIEIGTDPAALETVSSLPGRQSGTLEIDAGGKTASIVQLVPEPGPDKPLSVLEIETLPSGDPPINRAATRQPEAQTTAGRNLALALNGGRVAAITSSREPAHGPALLIDGDARSDWRSADTAFPEDIAISLGGSGGALIDSVDIFQGGYGAVPMIVDLAAATDSGSWVTLGRYGLHDSPVERLSFPPTAARFVRLRFISSTSDHFVTIGEIAVREVSDEGYEPHIATHWSGFKGGLDIAMAGLGGTIEAAQPYGPDADSGPNLLIDGYGAGTGAWANSDSSEVAAVTLGFKGGGEANIAGLSFTTNGGHSNFTADNRWTRMVDVWVSDADYMSGFQWLGRYALDQSDGKQVVSFAPVKARYLRVLMIDTFGSPGPVMGEIEVLEAPGTSITAGSPPNLLDLRFGGHVVVPAGAGRSYLIDSTAATDGWYDDTAARPVDLTFAFDQDQPRTFDAIGLNPRTSLDPATWARRAKVFVSNHPLRDFRLVGEFEIAAEDRLQYFAISPVTARYVKVRLLENGGNPVISLGEVAAREAVGEGEISSIATLDGGIRDATAPVDDTPTPFEGDIAEAEPNNSVATANDLPLGQRMTGAISPLTDTDWFGFDTTQGTTNAINAVVEEQPRLTSELSVAGPDGVPVGTQQLYDFGAPRADLTWLLPKGKNALSLSRAPNSVVFIVDRSGSVDSVRDDIAAAAVHFAENALPDEEISFVSMDGEVTYNDFATDKDVLVAAAQQTSQGSSGSPVYESLKAAMARLASRKGAKAIVIVTDGEDSGSSTGPLYELWDQLGKTGVRIYTVGFGPAVTHPLDGLLGATGGDMLRGFSAATGGRFFYAPSGDAMRGIYQRISADLRSESGYRLLLSPSDGTGMLNIASTGESISGVSAPRQVGLVLDASGSMKKTLEGGASRMTVARETLNSLVDGLPDASDVALVVYGHRLPSKPHDKSCNDIELVMPFGPLDRNRLHATIDSIRPRGETPIGRSLLALAESFDPATEKKFAILITDGEESCDPDPDDPAYPPTVVETLRAAGIDLTLSIVGFAIGDEATRDFLDKLATSTGGSYYDADNRAALDDALHQAFSAGFIVTDSLGQVAASGKVDSGPVSLPDGHWHVVLDSDPAIDLGTLAVAAGRTTQVELAREGDRVDIRLSP